MSNAFSKEERVAFETLLEGFNDALVLSKNVSVYRSDDAMMERANNIVWRPQPYIMQSFTGTDMSANFGDQTQLSVPATLGYSKSVPWTLTAAELRDTLQEGRLGEAAKQKLASDINLAMLSAASLYGSLVVKVTAAASGYADLALCDALMNEQGVPSWDRYAGLCSRDYNGMAADLSKASRSFGNGKSEKAYTDSFVGRVAGFDTYKLDYAQRITAAAGGGAITMSTLDGGGNYYTPKATSTATTGEVSNVDNRFQTITVSSTASVVAGDCFTVAALNAVHHVTKGDTGQLKTFRVVEVVDGTTLKITPPMITAQGATAAEKMYQNCVINTKAANSAIVWLNTAAAPINVFWQRDALEILPGRYAVPSDAGAAVMKGATDQGIQLVMQKQYDINTMKTKYRLDTLFGVVNKQPEMSGIILFSQT
jgi:hypothetical protein